MSLGPVPSSGTMEEVGGWGSIPSLEDLGLHEIKAGHQFLFDFILAITKVTIYQAHTLFCILC